MKTFNRANTLQIDDNKIENKKKLKLKKSLSFKDGSYSLNSILNSPKTIKFQHNYDLKLFDNNVENNEDEKSKGYLPRILSSDEIMSNIKSKLSLNKNASFFITDNNGIKGNRKNMKIIKNRKKGFLKKVSHFGEYLNYNVFNEKDIEIKDLIDNFNKQAQKKRINKIQRKQNILNKLYGITPEYNKTLKTAKSQKHLPLEEYQDKILLALNTNGMYSNENLNALYQKFKIIKMDIETVTPYPKINIKNIIKHFKNRIQTKNDKMLSLKEYLSKNKKPKDKFERDEQKIRNLKFKKHNNQISRIKYDNLYMLPPHVRKLFIK